MRLGIFGGSFDPVHVGHLQLAATCREHAALDEVWFMPAARQPFKLQGPRATDDDRYAMLELALADQRQMRVSRIELDRAGISYTVDTLRVIAAKQPSSELFLLLGEDALIDLPTWREAEEVCRLAAPLITARAGETREDKLAIDFNRLNGVASKEQIDQMRALKIDVRPADVSSTTIRHRIAEGRSISGLVPPDVAEYIMAHRLYLAAR
jgi:nicotinate-nucleotide adenylyltransferase